MRHSPSRACEAPMHSRKIPTCVGWRTSILRVWFAAGTIPIFAQTPVTLETPTSITASDGAYAGKIAITWDPVPRAKSYRIFRNTVNDPATASVVGATASWVFWDTAAPAAQTLHYWVRAENGDAVSALGTGDAGSRGNPSATGTTAAILEPPPEPIGNPVTAAKVALGKALFWDEQLSSTSTVACGTCHFPEKGGGDPRAAAGVDRVLHFGPDRIAGTPDDVVGSAGVPLTR